MNRENPYLRVAVSAAREAGRIQMVHYGRPYRIDYKGEIDPVTEIDRLCEKAITDRIRQSFPAHDLLTEESPYTGKGSSFKWIVDPIDGTTNYLREYPSFCTSIGLEVEGEMILGVVYNPLLDELFIAEKGQGATLNGKRIRVSKTAQLDGSFLCTGFPYDIRKNGDFYLRFFKAFLIRSFALRRPGSAVLDLCYVAAGRFDGFWEMKLHPWDVAAGSLIVTESGGKMTDFSGNPGTLYGTEFLASNGVIHAQMLGVIQGILKESEKTTRTQQEVSPVHPNPAFPSEGKS